MQHEPTSSEVAPSVENVRLSAAEREAVCRSSANHAKTIAAVERIVAERIARQAEEDLAMHHAYRPEAVAEVAVHMGSHEDWEHIAKWCGGTIGGDQDPSGEWSSYITLPNGEVGGEQSWLVLNHAGEFHFRTEVAAPSLPSGQSAGDAT